MRFIRSIYAQVFGFVAKSMDKDVRVGVVLPKQWQGAGNTVSFALKILDMKFELINMIACFNL